MKEKIYNKLKQEYSALGLGENVLQAQAESLANSGLVTDDNIDAVISAQRGFLEALQRANDKRATDAIAKAKESARKEFEEELKKKTEEENKKKEEEARKQAEEKAKKEEEAKRKAEEEAKKKAEEEAEAKRLEELKKKEVPEWYLKEREEREAKAKAERESFLKVLEELKTSRTKENEEFTKTLDAMKKENQSLISEYDALKKENEEAKAKAQAKRRADYILGKAKELGIPQDRIDEGFVIAPDAEDSAIDEYLSKVSSNIRTRELPQDKHFQKGDEKANKEIVDDVVKAMVK